MESLGLFPVLVGKLGWNLGFHIVISLGISQALSPFDCSSPKGGEFWTGGMTASQPMDLCQGSIRVSSFHASPYPKMVLVELDCASELPGGLVKHRLLAPDSTPVSEVELENFHFLQAP